MHHFRSGCSCFFRGLLRFLARFGIALLLDDLRALQRFDAPGVRVRGAIVCQ
jgi:hypothetical protein